MVAKALALAAGCALAIAVALPFLRSTDQFLPFAADARVRYEPGAEKNAAIIARALPEAIATVERFQFRPFAKPVTIYVCASTTTFDRHGLGVSGAGGFVLNGRLFISPKPQNTAERLPRILTHELSHLQLGQQLGMLRYTRNLPGWFKEGLAVHVSDGGGAETVSEAEGRDAIARDRTFRLHESGSLIFPQTGARDNLPAHLFYREGAMFVGFLARLDPAAFKRLLLDIQDRHAFADAVAHAYGRDLPALWREFSSETKTAAR